MGILSWIIMGALAGWAASAITGVEQSGCITNILVGIVGAFVGGLIVQLVGGEISWSFSLSSFGVATLGAVVLLAVTGFVRKK